MKLRFYGVSGKLAFIMLLLLCASNEVYRYREVKRLNEFDCRYTSMRQKGKRISLDPSRVLKEYVHVYECKDGVERTSIYRNDLFIRPWEGNRP